MGVVARHRCSTYVDLDGVRVPSTVNVAGRDIPVGDLGGALGAGTHRAHAVYPDADPGEQLRVLGLDVPADGGPARVVFSEVAVPSEWLAELGGLARLWRDGDRSRAVRTEIGRVASRLWAFTEGRWPGGPGRPVTVWEQLAEWSDVLEGAGLEALLLARRAVPARLLRDRLLVVGDRTVTVPSGAGRVHVDLTASDGLDRVDAELVCNPLVVLGSSVPTLGWLLVHAAAHTLWAHVAAGGDTDGRPELVATAVADALVPAGRRLVDLEGRPVPGRPRVRRGGPWVDRLREAAGGRMGDLYPGVLETWMDDPGPQVCVGGPGPFPATVVPWAAGMVPGWWRGVVEDIEAGAAEVARIADEEPWDDPDTAEDPDGPWEEPSDGPWEEPAGDPGAAGAGPGGDDPAGPAPGAGPAVTSGGAGRAREQLPEREILDGAPFAAAVARPGPSYRIRFSSGMPTLDLILTPAGVAPGMVAPGEMVLVAARSGTGKSSFTYAVIPGFLADLYHRWRVSRPVVLFHTEETSADKWHKVGFANPAHPWSHLGSADKLRIVDLSDPVAGRQILAETMMGLVHEAELLARATGRPISHFLPAVVIVDYLQGVRGGHRENIAETTQRTSHLLANGVAKLDYATLEHACNPSFRISDLQDPVRRASTRYRQMFGRDWPADLLAADENAMVAVVATVQFRKGDKADASALTLFYSGRGPAPWVDRRGNSWYWRARVGDVPLGDPDLLADEIAGSSFVRNDATAIVAWHRPGGGNAPSVMVGGRRHLLDRRVFLVAPKTRNGAFAHKVFPFEFDTNAEGTAGRHYDFHGEHARAAGLIQANLAAWARYGDPILPVRTV